MSTTTNCNLSKPVVGDKVGVTIPALSNNMDLIDTLITSIKVPEGWHVPTFTSGAGGQGAPYDYPKYYKDVSGIVHLSGVASVQPHMDSFFILPTGYRPKTRLIFATYDNDGVCRLDVTPDGKVQATFKATAGYISLCGISFRADSE